MEADSDMISFLNIGIGLNVNNDVSTVDQKATTVKEITGKNGHRKEILESFLTHLSRISDQIMDSDIISEWKNHTITLGKKVTVKTITDEYSGEAIDIDQNGALVLKLGDQSTKTIIYGDCFFNE